MENTIQVQLKEFYSHANDFFLYTLGKRLRVKRGVAETNLLQKIVVHNYEVIEEWWDSITEPLRWFDQRKELLADSERCDYKLKQLKEIYEIALKRGSLKGHLCQELGKDCFVIENLKIRYGKNSD